MNTIIKKEEKEVKGVLGRIKRRDFRGNTGLAIKNSIWQIATTLVGKVGSLIFTWFILMRLLPPEVFGLYSLALSTILLFAGFTDLGIGNTLIRYLAKNGKNKSKGYLKYLSKLKALVLVIAIIVLIALSSQITNYYDKPIYLALLAGSIYIFISNLSSYLENLYRAENNLRVIFYKEVTFQILRLILIPIAIILTLSRGQEVTLSTIILVLSICFLIPSIFLFFKLFSYKGKNLSETQKKEVTRFLIPLSATALSGVFFGYIDTVMLGRFVAAEFIAYYQAAFSLITSAMVVISFSGVLFPLFSRMKGKQLERGLSKSISLTLLMSLALAAFTIFIAPYLIFLIQVITGYDYSPSIMLLRILALILITDPLVGIYTSYFTSKGQTSIVAKSVIFSTGVNIILNLCFILIFLSQGASLVVLGVSISTVISRVCYLGFLRFFK